MPSMEIVPYSAERLDAVIILTVDAWHPVFEKTVSAVPRFVYNAFYPDGWEERQIRDVTQMLEDGQTDCWLAVEADALRGYVGYRLHPEDQMGEVYIIAVAPTHQGQGIGQRLMTFAEQRIRAAGMAMVMVETVGDDGHAPARHLYEAAGFEPWPVARYFKQL